MADSSLKSSVFTGNPMGGKPGDSAGLKRSSMPGGTTDLVSYPQDNVHGVPIKTDYMDAKMGGSVTNLAHSLTGASAVQRSKGKPESSGI